VRYVQVTLTAPHPDGQLQAVVGPVAVPVLGLQVPLFVALFERAFFRERSADVVQVLVPNFYVTQAPGWTANWETFRTRLNELSAVLTRLLSIMGAGPPAPGAGSILADPEIRRLSLWRGVFDYVANRAQTGKLEFLWSSAGIGYTAYITPIFFPTPGLSESPFRTARTIIVVNDASSQLRFAEAGSWLTQPTDVMGTNDDPVCVLSKAAAFMPAWGWIPRAPQWPEAVAVTGLRPATWQLRVVRVSFDQVVPLVHNAFPAPAETWHIPALPAE
jgi:hypothetical protein